MSTTLTSSMILILASVNFFASYLLTPISCGLHDEAKKYVTVYLTPDYMNDSKGLSTQSYSLESPTATPASAPKAFQIL